LPFLTINGAFASAVAGDEVFLYPGTYNEVITVPSGVALRGANSQGVIIQQINPVVPLAVVTMSQNSRMEDVTVNLSIAVAPGPGPFIAVDFANGASVNAKFRTSNVVVNLAAGNAAMYGIQSSGASALGSTVSHAIRSTSISVNGTGVLPIRGVIVNGPNRFVFRDCAVGVAGAGADCVACETTNALAFLGVKTSSLEGSLYDVLQTAGLIVIGATDLIRHTAPLSFTVDIASARTFFGIIGNPAGNTTYFLPPSIVPIASISTVVPYTFTLIEALCVYSMNISFVGSIAIGESATFTIFKNNVATLLTIVLTSASPFSVDLTSVGVTFLPVDTIDARLTTVGSPDVQAFIGKILTY
jgi:hypothetical protein